MKTRIDWMSVGREHTATEEQRERLLQIVKRIDGGDEFNGQSDCWLFVPRTGAPLNVAMMPGYGIKETIRQLRIPKVSHVAISHDCAPFGFYGIRGHYKHSVTAELFVLDTGDGITPLFCRVTEPESAELQPA